MNKTLLTSIMLLGLGLSTAELWCPKSSTLTIVNKAQTQREKLLDTTMRSLHETGTELHRGKNSAKEKKQLKKLRTGFANLAMQLIEESSVDTNKKFWEETLYNHYKTSFMDGTRNTQKSTTVADKIEKILLEECGATSEDLRAIEHTARQNAQLNLAAQLNELYAQPDRNTQKIKAIKVRLRKIGNYGEKTKLKTLSEMRTAQCNNH